MMTQPPTFPPAPATAQMTVGQLDELVRAGGPYRGKGVFALIDRLPDPGAVETLGQLAKLPLLRRDKLHMITLGWAAIIGLLAGETPRSRQLAYEAFADLDEREQADFLRYLKAESIEAAHPERP
jgi:hypothetical protein